MLGVEIGSAAAAAAAVAKLESAKSEGCFFSTARRRAEPEAGLAVMDTVEADIVAKNSQENPRN